MYILMMTTGLQMLVKIQGCYITQKGELGMAWTIMQASQRMYQFLSHKQHMWLTHISHHLLSLIHQHMQVPPSSTHLPAEVPACHRGKKQKSKSSNNRYNPTIAYRNIATCSSTEIALESASNCFSCKMWTKAWKT